MPERIQLSQEDEALRQADTDPTTLHRLMERIAQNLTITAPTTTITPYDLDEQTNRHAWAHLKATSRFGRVDCTRREALGATLLAAMPKPRNGETRGEYAIRLRAEAGR